MIEADATEEAHRSFGKLLKRSMKLDSDAEYLLDEVAKIKTGNRQTEREIEWHSPWVYPVRKLRDLEGISVQDWEGAFDLFATEEYASHPWHNHKQKIKKISDDLDNLIGTLHRFCEDSFTYHNALDPFTGKFFTCKYTTSYHVHKGNIKFRMPYWRYVRLKNKISEGELRGFMRNTATSLFGAAQNIRNNILLLQGMYYPKQWAVTVAMKYVRNTPERGDAIREMIENKRIPVTSTRLLSKLIKSTKDKSFFIHDEWKPAGNNQKRGFVLSLVPVKCSCNKWPDITPSLYAPAKLIGLRDYFGIKECARLYFSPLQFPTPVDLQMGDTCESFELLKSYIITQSKKEGEVSCRGGRKKGRSVRFSCKTKNCGFYFVLKWDRYGYYIHHHNPATDKYIGNVYHRHNEAACK